MLVFAHHAEAINFLQVKPRGIIMANSEIELGLNEVERGTATMVHCVVETLNKADSKESPTSEYLLFSKAIDK